MLVLFPVLLPRVGLGAGGWERDKHVTSVPSNLCACVKVNIICKYGLFSQSIPSTSILTTVGVCVRAAVHHKVEYSSRPITMQFDLIQFAY